MMMRGRHDETWWRSWIDGVYVSLRKRKTKEKQRNEKQTKTKERKTNKAKQ
jgi:hypothetical protein